MNVMEAITTRKSIRKFEDRPISRDLVEKILFAGTLAPSGHNKQPWKFYVVQGEKNDEMIQTMQNGIDRLEGMGIKTGSAKYTIRWMAQAPVTIFIFYPDGRSPFAERDVDDPFLGIVDIQSIGAAIQNMLLEATELGLGSLWICDVFAAYEEFCDWLNAEGQMIAAVSLGYPAQSPNPRPRKSVEEVTEFIG